MNDFRISKLSDASISPSSPRFVNIVFLQRHHCWLVDLQLLQDPRPPGLEARVTPKKLQLDKAPLYWQVEDVEDGSNSQLLHGWLVVWTPLKNISQLGWLFPIYGKIKNVPNHQPVLIGFSHFGHSSNSLRTTPSLPTQHATSAPGARGSGNEADWCSTCISSYPQEANVDPLIQPSLVHFKKINHMALSTFMWPLSG